MANISSMVRALLLFCLVSACPQEVTVPVSRPAVDPDPARSITVTLSIDTVFWNGEMIDRGQLSQRFTDAKARDPEVSLLLVADKRVPYGEVMAVVDAAKAAGIARFSLSIDTAQ